MHLAVIVLVVLAAWGLLSLVVASALCATMREPDDPGARLIVDESELADARR